MNGVAPGGLGVAQARIAEIQARLRSLSAAGPGGVVGNAAATSFADAMARTDASSSATPTAVGATPSAARGLAAGPTTAPPTGTTPSGDWAARLPAAGRPWAGAIQEAADRNEVDPALLAALVWTESGFQPDAVSHAGARGLAQLMPATAAGMGVDPDDPAQNLDGGARFLRAMLDRFGSVELGLAAYNAGPGRVAQAGGIPNIAETRAYVPKVLAHHAQLTGGTA